MSSSTRVLLIRHAQHHVADEDGRLTELGKQQADALARALRLNPPAAVVCSPFQRALQTASVLELPLVVINDLEEFRFGPAAPETREMVQERTDLTLWQNHHGFPGGETLGHFQARVGKVLEGLVSAHLGGAVAAVTHSGFIDAALRWSYDVSPEADWATEAMLPHASITEIEHWPSGRHRPGAAHFTLVHRVGDICHLEEGLVTDV